MTTLQVVVGNQSIDLSKGFTERCGWALTLWHPEPLTYWPTLGHSYHTGEAGLDPRSLYLEQPGGHSGEMETFRLRKSLEAPGFRRCGASVWMKIELPGQRSEPKSRTLSFHHPSSSQSPRQMDISESCAVPGREALAKGPGLQRKCECDPDTGGRSKG